MTPDTDPLWQTIGYVHNLTAEQEGTRTGIRFELHVHRSGAVLPQTVKCWIYLDIQTSLVLAQFQLLRDALWSHYAQPAPFPVQIHFNFENADEEWLFVYWVRLIAADTYPIQVGDFFDTGLEDWGYCFVTEAF